MVDIIDLGDAEDYGTCTACGRRWRRLADGAFALVGRGTAKSRMPEDATAVGVVTIDSERRYLPAERVDAEEHLRAHAIAQHRADHPPLIPALGPSVSRVIHDARAQGLTLFLDPAGELVIGRPVGTAPNVERDERVDRLRDYAPLIRAHLGGEPVACRALAKKPCTDAATYLALPARPLCPTHADAIVREAVAPPTDIEVEMPTKTAPRPERSYRDSMRMIAQAQASPYGLRRQR